MKQIFVIILSMLFCLSCKKSKLTIDNMFMYPSSVLDEWKSPDTYSARNLFNSPKQTWAEGIKGHGVGQFIFLRFNPNQYDPRKHVDKFYNIDTIKIINGFGNKHYYELNSRIKKLQIEIKHSGVIETDRRGYKVGSVKKCDKFIIALKDNMIDYQIIKIPKPYTKNIASICLTIKEVYKGSKYTDTCISGLQFMYKNKTYDLTNTKFYYGHLETLDIKEKFLSAINPTGKGWTYLYDKDNRYFIMDKYHFYINDNSDKQKLTRKGYVKKYKYKFADNKLYFLIHNKWRLVKYGLQFYYSECFSMSEWSTITFENSFLQGKYYLSPLGHKNQTEMKIINKMRNEIVPIYTH